MSACKKLHQPGCRFTCSHNKTLGSPPPPPGKSGKKYIKDIGRLFFLDNHGNLVNDNDFDYENVKNILSAIPVPKGTVPVISNERLAGHPFSNGFDREIICQRIKRLLPGARIFLVIREQRSILLSNYMQYLRYGGWHTFEQYVNSPPTTRQPTLTLNFWRYDRAIDLYQKTFGSENVLVLPYEMFNRTPHEFVKRICEFSGLPPYANVPSEIISHPRQQHFAAYHLRRLTCINRSTSANSFYPSLFHPRVGKVIDRGIKIAITKLVPPALEHRIRDKLEKQAQTFAADYFNDSNKLACEMTGLDLHEFGYQI